jgi:tetratricopeptide (TPR) repeat protein
MKNRTLLPFKEVTAIILKLKGQAALMKETKTESAIRILEYTLSYGESEFGEYDAGCSNRIRKDGSGLDVVINWNADIPILLALCIDLKDIYGVLNDSILYMNDICQNYCEKQIYYLKKCLSILEPWRLQSTLKANERTDKPNAQQINDINDHLSLIMNELGDVNIKMRNHEIASSYFEQAMTYSKGVIGEDRKAAIYYLALKNKGENLYFQMKYREAKVVFEEAYNIMAERHDPSYPDTLDAALRLIDVLIHTRDYYDGERYARMCYDLITHPVDLDNEDVARSASSLAQVSYLLNKENKVKKREVYFEIEFLFRKSIRIHERIKGKDCPRIVQDLLALSDVLQLLQCFDNVQRTAEIKDLLDRTVIIYTDDCVDSSNVRIANRHLALFHYGLASSHPPCSITRTTQLRIAESHYEETMRIGIKLYGMNDEENIGFKDLVTGLKQQDWF